jgi:hypothetical protein
MVFFACNPIWKFDYGDILLRKCFVNGDFLKEKFSRSLWAATIEIKLSI